MPSPTVTDHADAILITACSGLFVEHYLDLLDSLADVGLTGQFDLGLIDLGLTAAQQDDLRARGIQIVPGRWPIEPPPTQNALHMLAFAGKPFARDFFPGYQTYVWMDADMWVQTADFWPALIQGAQSNGLAVPIEVDAGYGSMTWRNRLWMFRHFMNSYGLRRAVSLSRQPMVNNGVFALTADAPHWLLWQKHFRLMVSRTERTLAIDQLSMMAMSYLESETLALIDASNNWVCSLGTPDYDVAQQRFVKPGGKQEVISVMHITTPSRARMVPVVHSDGTTVSKYLHRPGGRFLSSLEQQDVPVASHLPA